MPPENTDPVTKTETNEFDFESAKAENPRIRRRSLKTKPAAENTAVSAPATQPARPAITPDQPRPAVYAQPVTASGDTRPAPVRPSTGEPVEKPQSAPATGVLYYSNNPQKAAGARTTPAATQSARTSPAPTQPASARPTTTSMQNPITRPATTSHSAPTRPAATGHATHAKSHSTHTPQMSSARPVTGSATTPQTSFTRPVTGSATTQQTSAARAVSTTVASPASSSRPSGVSDFRNNIDRQSREQKSIGGILNIIVYGLIGLFVVAALLAAYGANDVYKQLHQQSVTVSDLDSRYTATFQDLNSQIKAQDQATRQLQAQLQGQLNQSQELLVRQQEELTKLQTALDAETEALRQERATRAAETSIRVSENSALRERVRALEQKNEQTYRP
jgi:hypothetical protein